MNETEIRQYLPLYADGELEGDLRTEVDAHLRTSAGDRAEVARWQALRRSARRGLSADPLPEGLEGRLRERLRTQQHSARRHALRWFVGVSAIAAALLLALLLRPMWLGEHGGRPSPPVGTTRLVSADDFAEVYMTCAVGHSHDSLEAHGDCPDKTSDRIAELAQFAVLVPDLADRGFALDGACRCFPIEDLQVVHAHYRSDDPQAAPLSVFSVNRKVKLTGCDRYPGGNTAAGEYEVASAGDVTVLKWDAKSSSYAVVGTMAQNKLRGLADSARFARFLTDAPALASLNRR